MKKISLSFFTLIVCSIQFAHAQNVAINANGAAPDASAMLDVQSINKGMLIPRMTTAQRIAIAAPATGLLVFDNTTNSFWFKSTTDWLQLVDSTNNIWTKKDTSVYVNHGENVGIGTTVPTVRLQVDNGTDVTKSAGGYLQLGASSNANLGFDNNEIQARDDSNFSDLILQAGGGNVGIGTKIPEVRLQISDGTDVSTAGGYLQLGAGTLPNLAFDNNEIQARNDGSASTLYLQNSGGNIQLGSSASASNLNMANGKLTKATTGDYNMIPLCYGRVSDNGILVSGTPNVSVARVGTGHYHINCTEINSSTITIATPMETGGSGRAGAVAILGIKPGQADVYFSYDGDNGDGTFSFIFYNP